MLATRDRHDAATASAALVVTTALVRLLWKRMRPVQLADARGAAGEGGAHGVPVLQGAAPRGAVVSEPAHDDATIAFLFAHSLAA